MVSKHFSVPKGYLHIPITCGKDPSEDSFYIKVLDGEKVLGEFLMGIAPKGEPHHFYVQIDIKRYGVDNVTLCCEQGYKNPIPENLFDGVIPGGDALEEKELYPNIYQEEIRQKLHFSSKCGWLNDPNGCFYKDGLFHLYYQHSPFVYHHNTVNMSWGHAVSNDGVHFTEIGDAIMPYDTYYNVASGTAIIDEYNISGLGTDTILAAYTDLPSIRYFGNADQKNASRQQLLYSKDGGYTFAPFPNSPFMVSPDGESWRDPKLLFVHNGTLCVALWETVENTGCISFYKTNDCKKWELCSKIKDFYECPDLFPLTCEDDGETLWVLYGGSGRYYIGRFENFIFTPIETDLYIDYGDSVYAAQSFNNIGGTEKRYHIGWLFDTPRMVNGTTVTHGSVPHPEVSSCQSMSLITELTLRKTADGYRVFRKPLEKLAELRNDSRELVLNGKNEIDAPGEIIFETDSDFTLSFGAAWVKYTADGALLETSANKKHKLQTGDNLCVRVIIDARSAEVFINDEFGAGFSAENTPKAVIKFESKNSVKATAFTLQSIWKDC